MQITSLVVLAALFLGLVVPAERHPAVTVPEVAPRLMPETQPNKEAAKKPEKKLPSVDDQIKALNLKQMNVNTAMGKLKTAKIENKVRGWATSGAASEFPEAQKAGVMVAGVSKMTEWKKHKKRTTDQKAFDQITTDLEAAGRRLAEGAGKKDADEVKAACDQISRNCSDCHSRFK
jgi:hypothetical protein